MLMPTLVAPFHILTEAVAMHRFNDEPANNIDPKWILMYVIVCEMHKIDRK